jgi:hypothetical protein
MEYLVVAGLLAIPLVILAFTGKLYYWVFLWPRYYRWSENPFRFSAYFIVYFSFMVYFGFKGIGTL